MQEKLEKNIKLSLRGFASSPPKTLPRLFFLAEVRVNNICKIKIKIKLNLLINGTILHDFVQSIKI